MRRSIAALIVVLGPIAPAAAETRFAPPQRQPLAESIAGLNETSAASDATSAHEEANAQSRARMDKFDRRITNRGNRAIRSICAGCSTTGTKPKWAPRRIQADAEEREMPISDPAQAPID